MSPPITTGAYGEWSQRWVTGMQAAESKTARRRAEAAPKAVAARAANAANLCGIKGCKRHAFKGKLCRAHWQMVPNGDKIGLSMACVIAQRRVAEQHHRRFLRELQARL